MRDSEGAAMKTVLKRTLALLLVLALTLGSVYIIDRVLLLKRYDGVKPMQSLPWVTSIASTRSSSAPTFKSDWGANF